jgi:nitric oxide dioxygenase
MEKSEIRILRRIWAQAASDPVMTGELFYNRLFKIAPAVKPMFSNQMAPQIQKLMDTLAFIVDNIEDFDMLLPIARELAKRHVTYGVLPEHYSYVGEALIWTFGHALGSDFSEKDKDVWLAVYTLLSNEMIQAAYPS